MQGNIRKGILHLFIVITICFGMLTTGFAQANNGNKRNILFFGDSITAGLGVGENNAYPAIIQQKIDSLGWNFNVINGGLSGETSTDGLHRIGWMLQRKISVFVLELGGNDGLRGINLDLTKRNLQGIIDSVKTHYPKAKIIIAGMQVPPNLGQKYTTQFKDLYPSLAKRNHAVLIPFILKGVGGVPRLNQTDGIHPTKEGHKIVAETVWKTLKQVLEKIRDKS
ncbi:MAG TPA: arylesterase [Balneolales bacterium]|nr:arylesterase [Balneolales bacterium]